MKVDLIWFNAGGGHRAAALALEHGIRAQSLPWQVRRVNLVDMVDPQGQFKRLAGFAPEDVYNNRLASGFTLGLAQELKLLQGCIRLAHEALVRRLVQHWQADAPDMVVSLIPNFNRCLHDALAQVRPGAPYVTVLTDMADHPPAFWIEPRTAQHVVCGTPHAAVQALSQGCASARVHKVSGMLLRPEFHAPPFIDRAGERYRLGLDARSPVGVVMFGGAGSRVMLRIAERLADTPLILLCGRNEALAKALRQQPAQAPRVVLGYTTDVVRWMQMGDFFIGKPGPGSISEAVQLGLPVIVTHNRWTMPQERFNADWVREHSLGLVLRSFAQVQPAVRELVAQLSAYQQRLRSVDNRAAMQVPRVLSQIALRAHTPGRLTMQRTEITAETAPSEALFAAAPPPVRKTEARQAEPAQPTGPRAAESSEGSLCVRTAWISDLHLGTPGCQAPALLDFLRALDCDTLYLVGDIVDGWQLRRQWYWPQSHNDVVQKLLRKARKGTRVVFVPGNHDEFARKYFGNNFGGIDVVPDALHRTADGRTLWITHGDLFDGVVQCAKWLAYVGDSAYEFTLRMNAHLNSLRARLGLPYWSLSRYLKLRVKRAVSYVSDFERAVAREAAKRGADGVVCGHIHHAELRTIDGVLYANDGDWVESLTALVEHADGRLEIVDWSQRYERAPCDPRAVAARAHAGQRAPGEEAVAAQALHRVGIVTAG
jgi:UDP-2,3-diacylglucosamine pyrophosphatase LpxH